MPDFRYAVSVMPKPGLLDPQGRAVEQSLAHLEMAGVRDVRVGRRVEITVRADSEGQARETAERLAGELLSNPLIETFDIESLSADPGAREGGGRPMSTGGIR